MDIQTKADTDDPGRNENASVEAGIVDSGRWRQRLGFLAIVLVGCAVRVSILSRGKIGYVQDIDLFLLWTRNLTEHGLGGFFEATGFCDYPPLYLLVMWGVGTTTIALGWDIGNDQLLATLLKVPPCMADLVIVFLLYFFGRTIVGRRRALAASALYFLNPITFYNSAYWGQIDAVHTALLLAAVGLVGRRMDFSTGVLAGLALLQKFQSIALLPLLLFDAYLFRRWRGLVVMVLGALLSAICVLLPFMTHGVAGTVCERAYVSVVGQYNQRSASAFNVWYLIGNAGDTDTTIPRSIVEYVARGRDSVLADESPLFEITWRRVSLVAFSILVAVVLSLYGRYPSAVRRYATAGLLAMLFFLVPTEMHERYAHPAVALLAIWAVTGVWRERAYVMLSLLLLLNYTYVQPIEPIAPELAGLTVLLLLVVMGSQFFRPRAPSPPDDVPMEVVDGPPPSLLVRTFGWASTLSLCVFAACGGYLFIAVRTEWLASRSVANSSIVAEAAPGRCVVMLDEVDPVSSSQSWLELRRGATVDGGVIQLDDRLYLRGIGVHAASDVTYDVPADCATFNALAGIDAETRGMGSAVLEVLLDGSVAFRSDVLMADTPPVSIAIPVGQATRLRLRALPTPDGISNDHVSWALARFECLVPGEHGDRRSPRD